MAIGSRYSQLIQLFTNPNPGGVALPGVAVTGTNTYLSNVIDMETMGVDLSIQVVYFGAMTGTFQLLASNDYNVQTGVGNFLPVSTVSLPATGTAVTHADGVTLATAHGTSKADIVTVAFTAPAYTSTSGALENPTNLGTITSATYGFTSGGVVVGDVIVVSTGADAGTYPIVAINSATSITVAVPAGKSFTGTTGQTGLVNSTLTGTLTSATGGFVVAGVQPGMQVTLGAGVDAGVYQILAVQSATVLLLSTTPIAVPVQNNTRKAFVGGSGLTYNIPQQWMVNLANPGARFYMVGYTNSSSTGTLYGVALGKG